jgi:shikimate dehydrogenase
MNKKKAYVIGTNVSTSLSPEIFNYWFKKHKINAEYGYIEIKEGSFDREIESILKIKDLVGLNITIPYKEKIFSYLTKKNKTESQPDPHWQPNEETALPINCLTINKDGISGTNTDWIGFNRAYIKHTKTNKIFDFQNEDALVLGYGGAAKGVVYGLVRLNFARIIVFNRTFNKIKNIVRPPRTTERGGHTNYCEIIAEKIANLNEYTDHNKAKSTKLIVSTTPTNILDNRTDWNVGKNVTGFDIVYRPREGTGFLKNFNPNNKIEGIQMLVYQAAPCFKLWFGTEPEADEELFEILYKKMDIKK